MVRVVMPEDFRTVPWKNGGGVTHEILRDGEGDTYRWRISIAEVSTDGPFSVFAGMSRILTVLDGAGLELHTPGGVLRARPFRPLAFSGDTPVDSRMVDGPVRDLNLIYDPRQLRASVEVIEGPVTIEGGSGQACALSLGGEVAVGDTLLPTGAFGLGRGETVTVGQDARCILLRLD